jgi:hypothetical protein
VHSGAAAAAGVCDHVGSLVTCTYAYSGAAETWTVPPGVTSVSFQVVGAPGGRSGGVNFAHADGGRGADLRATLALDPGTPVVITVGGPGGTDGREAGGFNGGGGNTVVGNSYPLAGGGGGASDVRIGGAALADRVLVAGGGGGGGGFGSGTGPGGSGGPAGGTGGDAGAPGAAGVANAGTGSAGPGGGGGAGTTIAGGAGGAAGGGLGAAPGGSGSLGQGGAFTGALAIARGGGGGGGLFGGGSGGGAGEDFQATVTPGAGGGGGGASGHTTGFGIADVSLGIDTARVPKVVITYVDEMAPNVSIDVAVGQASPAASGPVRFTATFDEPVSGVTDGGFALNGTADLAGAVVSVTGGPSVYDVTVSGATGPGTVTLAAKGGAAVDAAGNSSNPSPAAASVTLEGPADSTAPSISANVAGMQGSSSWYVDDVTVSWTVTDGESPITSQTGCATQTLTTDTSGTTFTCSATSGGGSASSSVTIKRDATAPVVFGGTPDRAPDSGDWYNAPVTVTFTGADATSGISSCTSTTYSGPDVGLTTERGSCTDRAGNTSGYSDFDLSYDSTPPVVSPPSPESGTVLALGQPVTATADASDSLSGVDGDATCSPVDTSSTGSTTVTCNATDAAGNTGSSSASYRVSSAFLGFISPLPKSTQKAGSTIPVKFALGSYSRSGPRITNAITRAVITGGTPVACTYSTTASAYQCKLRMPRIPGGYAITIEQNLGTTASPSWVPVANASGVGTNANPESIVIR